MLWCLRRRGRRRLRSNDAGQAIGVFAGAGQRDAWKSCVPAVGSRSRRRIGDRRRNLWHLSAAGSGVIVEMLRAAHELRRSRDADRRVARRGRPHDKLDVHMRPSWVGQAAMPGGRSFDDPATNLNTRSIRHALSWAFVFATFATQLSCTRPYYRRQADREVNCIIDNKSMARRARRRVEFRIDVDPRSRMFDPNSPDCPPMPPDDPMSHQLMHCVDCKPGSPCWKHMGKTPYVDNPTWEDYLPRDEDGNVVLDLTGAVQLALLESPEYQQQLETLYLSGLDVTFERFRFDTQFFGGSSIFYTAEGPERSGTAGRVEPAGGAARRDPDNRFRVEKLTATGGELVVGFANSLMWQFAGPDNYTSSTLLDFNLVQPLLRARRPMPRDGAAHDCRAGTAGQRAADGALPARVLLERRDRPRSGAGPEPPRRFLRRQRLGRFQRRRRRRLRPRRRFRRQLSRARLRLHRRRRRPAGGRLHRPAANGAGHPQSVLRTSPRWATAWNSCRPRTTPGGSTASRSIWPGKRCTTRRASCSTREYLRRCARQLQAAVRLAAVARRQDCRSDAGHFNLLDPELSALQIRVTDVLTVLREGRWRRRRKACRRSLRRVAETSRRRQERDHERRISTSLVKRGCGSWERRRKSGSPRRRTIWRGWKRRCRRGATLLRATVDRKEARKRKIDPDLVSVERLDERVAASKQEYETLGQQMAEHLGRAGCADRRTRRCRRPSIARS